MRIAIERAIGYVVVLSILVAGVIACTVYVIQDAERQRGAGALAIGVILVVCVWFWITRGRNVRDINDD